MKFTKMHGNGNDFIVIEDLENKLENESTLAKKICHRNFGIGADGLLIVRKSKIADIKMTIINADGSLANMCGNGIRCFAKHVWENGLVVKKENINIETDDGVKTAYLKIEVNTVKEITINMGVPTFVPKEIPVLLDHEVINEKIVVKNKEYIINTILLGVPHTVIIGDMKDFQVEEGKAIEKFELFPKGTNVNFCQIINSNKIKIMTWERGAGATLACGTGSCASVVIAHKLGLIDNKAIVEIPGGSLVIEISNDGVLMTGPAITTFVGELYL